MIGLKFSALNQLRLLTAISTIDDLNYLEKIDTYYIVVKPFLKERTRKKIQVLQGYGKEELLKQQFIIVESISPIRQGSFYVDIPKLDHDDAKIAKTIEIEFYKLENQKNGFTNSLNGLTVNGH
ncbi:hypothetical protein GYH30_000639 [Glycine max]|uniref:Uncharacterized protein n=2 Tax=Glycine subgen. Soja TaxID=1462606 RepID=K7K254_SOYBN|nr:hypothetical protein GYH30_000639 [Glycine max]RZC28719.1 hypothetical protein D0Y65_000617 [Glycine soja]